MRCVSVESTRPIKALNVIVTCCLLVFMSGWPALAAEPAQNNTGLAGHPLTQQEADAQISGLIAGAERALNDSETSGTAYALASKLFTSALALLQDASPAGIRMLMAFPTTLRARAAAEAAAGHADKALRFSIFADASSAILPTTGDGSQRPAAQAEAPADTQQPAQPGTMADASKDSGAAPRPETAPSQAPNDESTLPNAAGVTPPEATPSQTAMASERAADGPGPTSTSDGGATTPIAPRSPADATAPSSHSARHTATPLAINQPATPLSGDSAQHDPGNATPGPDAQAPSPPEAAATAAVPDAPASSAAPGATPMDGGPPQPAAAVAEAQQATPKQAAPEQDLRDVTAGPATPADSAPTTIATAQPDATPQRDAAAPATPPHAGDVTAADTLRPDAAKPSTTPAAEAAKQGTANATQAPHGSAPSASAPDSPAAAADAATSPPGRAANATPQPGDAARGTEDAARGTEEDLRRTDRQELGGQPTAGQPSSDQQQTAMLSVTAPRVASQASPAIRLSASVRQALLKRGDAMLELKDLSAARMLFARAAEAGVAVAALKLGDTYNPTFLAQHDLRGVRPDPAVAVSWYRKALELGEAQAADRLRALGAPTTPSPTQ